MSFMAFQIINTLFNSLFKLSTKKISNICITVLYGEVEGEGWGWGWGVWSISNRWFPHKKESVIRRAFPCHDGSIAIGTVAMLHCFNNFIDQFFRNDERNHTGGHVKFAHYDHNYGPFIFTENILVDYFQIDRYDLRCLTYIALVTLFKHRLM